MHVWSKRMRTVLALLSGGLAITAGTLWIYRPLWTPSGAVPQVPWGSDTLGHVLKALYLDQQLAVGNLYPDLLPHWYLGLEFLRYHPPLAYYLLVLLLRLGLGPVAAANLFIVAAAWLGGMGWLLYRRWWGTGWATLAGLLYLFLPDHVRVALAEGNLPRVLANALLPYLLYALLRSLEGSRKGAVGLALLLALTVLAHPMIAAIDVLLLGGLALLLAAIQRAPVQGLGRSLAALGLGVLLSSAWLIPSLRGGGIARLNPEALQAAQASLRWDQLLALRLPLRQPEAPYVGLILLLLTAVGLLVPQGRSRWSVAFGLTGLAGILIATPALRESLGLLPLKGLFWPLRFLGTASTLLLAAVVERFRGLRASRVRLWILPALLLLIWDQSSALALVHLRPPREEVRAVARALAVLPGWREATLDRSRLGSEAPYRFAAEAKREQVFGWAYQGANTAPEVAALNEALGEGKWGYLLDRLERMGVDDVVLELPAPETPALRKALGGIGFSPVLTAGTLVLLHRDGAPRACRLGEAALGIGTGARTWAFLFPQIALGTSPYLDAYPVSFLRRFRTVVLAGARWRDRRAAEERATELASAGVRVVVDLAGMPEDPLARIPRFLGVWGERIFLDGRPLGAQAREGPLPLQPFGSPDRLWAAPVPQGVDGVRVSFDYLGERAVLIGYRQVEGGKVWFVGGNLAYHAYRSGDPAALALLAELLGLSPDRAQGCDPIPLEEYRAGADGYRFRYRLEEGGWILIPVADHDGLQVRIDGTPVSHLSVDGLVAVPAPAGLHAVEMEIGRSRAHTLGLGLSLLSLPALGMLGGWPKEGGT